MLYISYFHSFLIEIVITYYGIGNTYTLRIVLQANGQINNRFSYKIGWSSAIQVNCSYVQAKSQEIT